MLSGSYWISHHRYFGYIKRYDTRLILLNFVFLFFIICMPSLSSLLGQYVFVPVALIAYTVAIARHGLLHGIDLVVSHPMIIA